MSKNSNSSAIPLTTAVFITFLVLKLTDTIDWSWWWITSPLWMPIAALAAVGITLVVVTSVLSVFSKWGDS